MLVCDEGRGNVGIRRGDAGEGSRGGKGGRGGGGGGGRGVGGGVCDAVSRRRGRPCRPGVVRSRGVIYTY